MASSTLLSYYTWLCLCLSLCSVAISANPHAIRHRKRNESNYNHENSEKNVEYLDPCNELNNCNGPLNGQCVLNFDGTGKAVCSCNDGYFGSTCEIEPVEILTCTMVNNRMKKTCPPGTFCILENIGCHFFPCTFAKGYCVPEPRLLDVNTADRKSSPEAE